MKILYVITSLQIGGAEKLIVDIVPRLRQIGQEIDVCLFNGKDTPFKQQLQACGSKIYDLSYNERYYSPIKILKLWRIMRHYDVVHTHNTAPQLFAAIANIICNKKLVTTEHSTNSRRRDFPILRYGDKWMYGRYDSVICISEIAEKVLKEYLEIGPHTPCNICTINNGIDVARFYYAQPLDRKNVGSDEKRFVIVMVAGFRDAKDQETVIRAIAKLKDSKYELWLVGDGERRQAIEQCIKDEHVENQVKLLGVRMDVPSILKAADVVVMSSHWEGLSLSNIEGMSVGKPFVASDVNGLREVTKGYGILFPHGDDQALADEIKRLAKDRPYYDQIAALCYERARQFDIEKMVEQYYLLYKR